MIRHSKWNVYSKRLAAHDQEQSKRRNDRAASQMTAAPFSAWRERARENDLPFYVCIILHKKSHFTRSQREERQCDRMFLLANIPSNLQSVMERRDVDVHVEWWRSKRQPTFAVLFSWVVHYFIQTKTGRKELVFAAHPFFSCIMLSSFFTGPTPCCAIGLFPCFILLMIFKPIAALFLLGLCMCLLIGFALKPKNDDPKRGKQVSRFDNETV